MKILKKFIPIIVTLSILISYIMPIKVYADDPEEVTIDDKEFTAFSDADGLMGALDGIVGVLLWLPRAWVAINIIVGETIISQVIMQGQVDEAGWIVDMEDIIFSGMDTGNVTNQVNLLDVNYFDFSSNDDNVIEIKTQVAKWYYILRNIAIGISLLVLIYIGIRMAISAIAEEKAKYKSMIKDWLVGFILLFVLHLIMVAILTLNSKLVGIIYQAGGLNGKLGGYENALMRNMFSGSFLVGIGSMLVVFLMFGMKIAFFWTYLKRVFTIGFLIVISPLITITYSIDKLGDGKSQALSTWMKEFVMTLLIQPFHCIIYLIFVSAGLSMIGTGTLRGIIFAIGGMLFIYKAEGIVKQIFGIDNKSMGKLAEAIAVDKLISGGSKAAGATSGAGGGSGSPAAGPVPGGSGGGPGGGSGGGTGGGTGGGVNRKPVPSPGTSGNGGNSSGRTPSGNTPSGNTPSGNTPSGNTPSGNTPSGNTPSGNTSSGAYSSASSRVASASTTDKIRSKLNEIKADPKQAAKEAAGNAGLRAKSLGIKALAATSKAAPKLAAGLVTAGMSGSAITGFAVGKNFKGGKYTRSFADGLSDKATEYDEQIAANQEASMEKALENQEERDLLDKVEAAYDDYRQWHPGEDISGKAEEFLYDDPDDKQGMAYAESLRNLNEFYEQRNFSGSEQMVLDKVDEMIDGKNKPVSKAVGTLMDESLRYGSKDRLQSNTDAWMASMDDSARRQEAIKQQMDAESDPDKKKKLQEDYDNASYLKSSDFEGLSKSEKKLARKIHMSKTNLETQYNSAKVEIPTGGTLADARQRQREESRTKANAEIAAVISRSYDKKKKA